MSNKLIILSGGFDPIHDGHVRMIQDAAKHGDVLICLNSDEWLTKKKGKQFMSFESRKAVLQNMLGVVEVIGFEDDEHGSACGGITAAFSKYHDFYESLVFANGGDRRVDSTPSHEQILCEKIGVELMFGVGGEDKPNSSSWILKDWVEFANNSKVFTRPWGSYQILLDLPVTKVKLLTLTPDASISLQYHHHRTEQWYCVAGSGLVQLGNEVIELTAGKSVFIDKEINHKLTNNGTEHLLVVEVQLGTYFGEDDIVRLEDKYGRV